MKNVFFALGLSKITLIDAPVSYTHLDVYKRQDKVNTLEELKIPGFV